MITRPFNFVAQVRQTRAGIDLVPFVDVCIILLFFGLFGSRFILAPGVAVDLQLPAASGAPPDAVPTSRVLTVGEVGGREVLMFEGRILDLEKFERFLKERAGRFEGEVLLLRMDRDVSMVFLTRVMETAKIGGFARALLAVEPEPATQPSGKER